MLEGGQQKSEVFLGYVHLITSIAWGVHACESGLSLMQELASL